MHRSMTPPTIMNKDGRGKTMKVVARGLAIAIVAGGFLSTWLPSGSKTPKVLVARAAVQNMPIPVCPPNDPNACHIDKW